MKGTDFEAVEIGSTVVTTDRNADHFMLTAIAAYRYGVSNQTTAAIINAFAMVWGGWR